MVSTQQETFGANTFNHGIEGLDDILWKLPAIDLLLSSTVSEGPFCLLEAPLEYPNNIYSEKWEFNNI